MSDIDLNTPQIVLGTDYYGKLIHERAAFELLDFYYENGGNIIDTAHVYTDMLPGEKHASEKTIGKWLKASGLRNNIIISTKGAFPYLDDMRRSRLSRIEIESDLNSSLKCLGIDSIDLYWLHRDDVSIAAGELIEILNDFVRVGKIKHFGASNWRAARIEATNRYAAQKGLQGFSASQIKWSLAKTTPEAVQDDTLVEMDDNEYAWYKANKFPVFAYSPQAKGFFSKLQFENGRVILQEGKSRDRYFNDENIKRFYLLRELSKECGYSAAQLALKWLMQKPFTVFPILGCRSVLQLRESMGARRLAYIEKLDKIL